VTWEPPLFFYLFFSSSSFFSLQLSQHLYRGYWHSKRSLTFVTFDRGITGIFLFCFLNRNKETRCNRWRYERERAPVISFLFWVFFFKSSSASRVEHRVSCHQKRTNFGLKINPSLKCWPIYTLRSSQRVLVRNSDSRITPFSLSHADIQDDSPPPHHPPNPHVMFQRCGRWDVTHHDGMCPGEIIRRNKTKKKKKLAENKKWKPEMESHKDF
jgi:hypothetical protein